MSCGFQEAGDLVENLVNHVQSSSSPFSIGAKGTAASGGCGPCHLVTLFKCGPPPLAALKENLCTLLSRKDNST